MQGSLNTLQQD